MRGKRPNRHRWVKSVAFELSDNQAAAMASGAHVKIDDDQLIRYVVGCYDCGLPYEAVKNTPCDAEARR